MKAHDTDSALSRPIRAVQVDETLMLIPSGHGEMTKDIIGQLFEKWTTRSSELRKLGAMVEGAELCDALLADLATVIRLDDRTVTLTEAAVVSRYSREHLGRLVRRGVIPNAGRPYAPRIYLRDLPHKAGHLPPERVSGQVTLTSKAQIVRSIVNPLNGGHDG